MEESTPRVLVVHEAARCIDRREVLAGASIQVPRAAIVGLLGPNGAGKTSLLRAIAGRLRLDAGEVRIDGLLPPAARRLGRLGIVPQEIALFAHLTVEENLSVLGRLAGVPPAALRERVRDGLEWASLADRSDAIVATLSGGMKRRVNLVAGMLHRPALLLLDEPTVGVDADARARLHELLRALRHQGIGLLIATHDADEAAVLCDEVAVMVNGRVVAQAPIAHLVRDVFGDRREVSLVIEPPVSPACDALLRHERFQPAGEGRWVSRGSAAHADLDVLLRRLAAAGGRVVETRIAEPHLRGAVALLVEQHGSRQAA